MKYNIKAIPTVYKGVNFRSRLEANWASFFDILGWDWTYEPFDLDGWIPDFLIRNPAQGRGEILAEVKPFTGFNWVDDNKAFLSKLALEMRSATKSDVLILGTEFPSNPMWVGVLSLGALVEGSDATEENRTPSDFVDAAILNRAGKNYDISASYGSFTFRFSGQYEGDHHLDPVNQGHMKALFQQAKNKTQWKK